MHKILSRIALAASCLVLIISCDTNSYETTESGVAYKFFEEGEGESPSHGDVIVMRFKYQTAENQVFFNSANQPDGLTTMVFDTTMFSQKGSVEEVISMLQVGDSVEVKVDAKTFYKKTWDQDELPDSIDENTHMIFNISLVEVADRQEYFERITKEFKDKENKVINDFISEKGFDDVQTTDSGLRYVINKNGTGEEIEMGDSVTIDYIGYLLDGTIFDSSLEDVAREADVFQQGRPYEPFSIVYNGRGFIRGWNEGIGYLTGGDEATLIIPSGLAYGPQGQGNIIKPNSILAFDMFIRDVKKNNN